jgi:hypothetical protein
VDDEDDWFTSLVRLHKASEWWLDQDALPPTPLLCSAVLATSFAQLRYTTTPVCCVCVRACVRACVACSSFARLSHARVTQGERVAPHEGSSQGEADFFSTRRGRPSGASPAPAGRNRGAQGARPQRPGVEAHRGRARSAARRRTAGLLRTRPQRPHQDGQPGPAQRESVRAPPPPPIHSLMRDEADGGHSSMHVLRTGC